MTASQAVVLILQLMGARETKALRARAEAAAPLFVRAVKFSAVDPVVFGAVIMKESSFLRDARGAQGELGYGQIKPGRFARKLCPGLNLSNPGQNMLCAARYLADAMRVCGKEPAAYLSKYNGRSCGTNEYTERVLAIAARVGVKVAVLQ